MICKRCGAEVADELTFCTVCGEAMEEKPIEEKKEKPSPKKKLMLICGGVVAAVILVLLIVLLFSGDDAEDRVEELYDSVVEYDANALMDALPPAVKSHFKSVVALEDSELEIVNSRELNDARVEELDLIYQEAFGTDPGYIEAASVVEIELSYHGQSLSRDPISVYMVKVDGSWYLDVLYTVEELDEADWEKIDLPNPLEDMP